MEKKRKYFELDQNLLKASNLQVTASRFQWVIESFITASAT